MMRTNDGKSSLRLSLQIWKLIKELIDIELKKEDISPAKRNMFTRTSKDIEDILKNPL